MSGARSLFKKVYSAALRIAWHLRGQKEHLRSGMAVPVAGFISEDSILVFPSNISLQRGSTIMPGARLICASMPPYLEPSGTIEIGVESIVRENAILQTYGGYIKIGRSCTVNPFCLIQGNGGVEIGDNVLIASHVCMYSANHVFSNANKRIREQGETRIGIKIGNDVWIGGGAIILDGVSIGDGAVVAAGAVVNRDVASLEVVGGVPGRKISVRGANP